MFYGYFEVLMKRIKFWFYFILILFGWGLVFGLISWVFGGIIFFGGFFIFIFRLVFVRKGREL